MTEAQPARLVVGLGNPGPEYDWTRHNMGFHVLDHVAAECGQLFQSASQFSVSSQASLSQVEPGGRTQPASAYTGSKAFVWARADHHGEQAFRGPAWLVKPMTYMNRSGKVVGPIARYLTPPPVPPARPSGDDAGDLAGEHAERSTGEPVEPPLTCDPSRILVVYDDMDLPLGSLRIRPHGSHGGQNGMRSIIEHLGTNRFPRLRIGIGGPGTDAVRHVLETFPPAERVEAEISVREAAEAILDWLEHGDLPKCMSRFHSRWNRES